MAAKELKRLQVLRDKIESELSQVQATQKDASKKAKELAQKKQALDCQIHRLSQSEIIVSEHAFLRFFERVKGFDLKQIEQEILSETVKTQISTLRSGSFPSVGCILKVRDGVVTTVIAKNGHR